MRRIATLLLLPFAAACYTYVPLATPEPAPGTKVSLVLSDQGRVEAAPQIGPYAVRVEGSVVQSTDANYLLSVTDVVDIRGTRSKWTGETVPLQRTWTVTSYEKRFSRSKTLMLAAGAVGAFVAIVVGRNLLGIGGQGDNGGPGPDPNGQ